MELDLSALRRRFDRLNGGSVCHDLDCYGSLLQEIEAHGVELAGLEDSALRESAQELCERARSSAPEKKDEALVVEVFALVREAARRLLGMRPYDVQILAGLALADGKLIEMATGEGKTLAAVAPATLAGLSGQGVHILTFNDYLSRRDAEWMGPVYRFFGLSDGWVEAGMPLAERRAAYAADITYATAKEAGFDLLREHLASEPAEFVHRPFHFAIVDEADSILVDEARVPLVLAGSSAVCDSNAGAGFSGSKAPNLSRVAPVSKIPARPDAQGIAELVRSLERDHDWSTDEYQRAIELTDAGMARVEAGIGCGNLVDSENLDLLTEIHCALHAAHLLHRDIDYIVQDGRIQLVDDFTGRVVEDRHWPDGLQVALETKERLERRPEGRILASITLEHYLGLYPRLAGMTATAQPAAREVKNSFGLDVVVIPPNRTSIRIDEPDLVFTHRAAKHEALLAEITRLNQSARPVLLGTASVEESEMLGTLLRNAGIACELLNARDDAREAAIIAEAGALGAVTISTNMAGRGTDIKLGGADQRDREAVVALGGLCVLGTNRHESLRIDQQLRGRAGRQGDPGSSRFFLSLEDPLIVRFGVHQLIPPKHYPSPQDEPLDNPFVRREIARAQRIIEGQNTEIRQTLHHYSKLLEEQRREISEERRAWLERRAPSRLSRESPERYREVSQALGAEAVAEAERSITLAHLDRAWSDHLARAADLREGIHLLRIGGEDPLVEFTRAVADSFEEMKLEVEREIVGTFEAATITAAGIDLEGFGLAAPTATWTYLVNDDPFREQLATALGGRAGVGAGAAALAGPIWIASALYQHFWKKRRSRRERIHRYHAG